VKSTLHNLYLWNPVVKRKLKTGRRWAVNHNHTFAVSCYIYCATCFGFGYKSSWGTIKILVRRTIFYNMATFSATEISKLCVREAENKITGITLFILFSILHFRLLQHTIFCNVEISIIWNFILLYTSARSTRFLFLSSPITPFSQSRNLSHNTYCDTAIARCDWLVPFPFLMYYITQQKYGRPIPVAARSKAFLCGRSLGGIAGLNPAGGVDGRLLCLLCVVQVAASANELITRSEESYPLCV